MADVKVRRLLFMHSYGGVVGCEAVKGMGKMERRKEGKTGDVSSALLVSPFRSAQKW